LFKVATEGVSLWHSMHSCIITRIGSSPLFSPSYLSPLPLYYSSPFSHLVSEILSYSKARMACTNAFL
jgi:hypothetical protein